MNFQFPNTLNSGLHVFRGKLSQVHGSYVMRGILCVTLYGQILGDGFLWWMLLNGWFHYKRVEGWGREGKTLVSLQTRIPPVVWLSVGCAEFNATKMVFRTCVVNLPILIWNFVDEFLVVEGEG